MRKPNHIIGDHRKLNIFTLYVGSVLLHGTQAWCIHVCRQCFIHGFQAWCIHVFRQCFIQGSMRDVYMYVGSALFRDPGTMYTCTCKRQCFIAWELGIMYPSILYVWSLLLFNTINIINKITFVIITLIF